MKGRFIVIEGVDFTGKTTQSKKLQEFLTANGEKVIYTREPGGTKLGEDIRNIIMENKREDPSKQATLLLFMAARAENIAKVIKPALEAGTSVICDRFIASTIVYQGVLSGFKKEDILKVHDTLNFGLYPDLSLILNASLETIKQRRARGADSRTNNKYDFLPDDIMLHLQDGFLNINKIPKMNAHIIDSNGTEEETFERIKKHVLTFI